MTLLDALRNYGPLTGTKEVCDRATCGACGAACTDTPVTINDSAARIAALNIPCLNPKTLMALLLRSSTRWFYRVVRTSDLLAGEGGKGSDKGEATCRCEEGAPVHMAKLRTRL